MFKKRLVKLTAFAMAAAVMLSVLGGCGSKKKAIENSSTAVPTVKLEGNKVSAQPITVRVLTQERANNPITDNMPVMVELSKRTNVNFKFEVLPAGANAVDKFGIIIASGDIPDLVCYSRATMERYEPSGVFEPLNDLMSKYGANITKGLQTYPTDFNELKSSDGKIYYVPNFKSNVVSELLQIRADWLTKLNIKVPETINDWYTVLKAFKEKDPNGNGKKDEIPLINLMGTSGAGSDGSSNTRGVLRYFMSAFDGAEEGMTIDNNGKVIFGSIDPRMKQALAEMQKWYSEGLLDKEYLLTDRKKWETMIANNIVGVYAATTGRMTMNATALKITPTKDIIFANPIKDTKGQSKYYGILAQYDAIGLAISSNSKYKVELMKMLDYIFTEEGSKLMVYGVENQQWVMNNGKPAFNETIFPNTNGKFKNAWVDAAFEKGIMIGLPMGPLSSTTRNFMIKDPAQDYYDAAIDYHRSIAAKRFPNLKYTEEEKNGISSKWADIQTARDEAFDKIIVGTDSIDKWDEFVKKAKTMGIDDVLKVNNDAYKRLMK